MGKPENWSNRKRIRAFAVLARPEVGQIEGKVVIIYRHRAVFDLLYLYGGFGSPAYIKGTRDEGGGNDGKQKDRFNNDPDCRVMLGQAEAIKYGHTLISDQEKNSGQHVVCTMIFFESSYSL